MPETFVLFHQMTLFHIFLTYQFNFHSFSLQFLCTNTRDSLEEQATDKCSPANLNSKSKVFKLPPQGTDIF